jgi:HlyD family secretion protein
MRNAVIFTLVGVGLAGGVLSAWVNSARAKPLPPVFDPAPDPFARGIYAVGIVESYQAHGENVNLYPQVAGTITHIFVSEGQSVRAGEAIFALDDSVQRATAAQLRAQAEAAEATLEELKAQPRPEVLAVARAQVEAAGATLKTAEAQRDKQVHAWKIEPKAVSKDALDNAINAAKAAKANLGVAERQYLLTKAGAWSYDIKNQERVAEAASRAASSAEALLAQYVVRAPRDGVVLSVRAAVGGYASPTQGAYQSYTQAFMPPVVLGDQEGLAVRVYVDEILIPRLPPADKLRARMFIRGTENVSVPLEFARVQPFVTPKIELSNERTERVDLRVLPIVFRFTPPKSPSVYAGQLVDVYVGEEGTQTGTFDVAASRGQRWQ